MVEPISIGVAIGMLVKSAPGWFHTLESTLISKGKDLFVGKGKERVQEFLDEKKHRRHIELALQNAAERGLRDYGTPQERDAYRSVIQLLSEAQSEALRGEALSLLTYSDDPDLTKLSEKYQLSQRITALATHQVAQQIDATPYLHSFFQALLAELYNDPLFREQMSDVIKVRAATRSVQSLDEIVATLRTIKDTLAQDYSAEQFQHDVHTYVNYVEGKLRHHKFTGIVFRGGEDKAPELESIFVPLRISLQDSTSTEKNTEDLHALLEEHPYLVMLGVPGAGKSTTTRYLAWCHARANATSFSLATTVPYQVGSQSGQPVPLRIELRLLSEARRQQPGCSFLAYTTEILLKREDVSVSSNMFTELLERRAMLLLFDGLDEVPTLKERLQLVEEIESFAQRYPGNRILVTSRPVGYEIAGFTDPLFQHCQLQNFDDKQIHRFLVSWYMHVLKYTSLPPDIEHELEAFYSTLLQNERLHKLAANPLLLTVMTALHRYERLPDERVLIYEKCADLLLDTWAKLKYEGTRWRDMKMGKRDQIACLAHLGFFLHQRSQEATSDSAEKQKSSQDTAVDVSERIIHKEIRAFLKNQDLLAGAEQNAEAERFLALVRTEAGLLVSRGTSETGEPLYGFVHRTFQEYFAAMDVWERFQQESDQTILSDFLSEHVHEPHWHEVILLLLGKLPRKVATNQLRHVLKGENRLSQYTDLLKHDLFFVCDCLADGITVERDFAQQIISEISTLAKTSPFPSQAEKAVSALGKLLRTRQYAELGRKALVVLINDDASLDFELKIRGAKILYQSSPVGSEEKREGFCLLKMLGQRENLTVEQLIEVARVIYSDSPGRSVEEREGFSLLKALGQRRDLTVEQLMLVVSIIYVYSPGGSDEEREGVQLLIKRAQQGDLAVEQLVGVVEVINGYIPEELDERRKGTVQLLIKRAQQGDLAVEQLLQLIEAIDSYSPEGSDERQEGAHLLKILGQRKDLTVEQLVQVAGAIFSYSRAESEEQRESFHLLRELGQQKDLIVEQRIQIAETICHYSPAGSEEKREAFHLLKELGQRGDLTVEQQIQVARAIYRNGPPVGSDRKLGTRLLIARAQRGDLTVEQQVQVAEVIYRYSPVKSNEQHEGFRLLNMLGQRADLTIEQLVEVSNAIYRRSPEGLDELRNALQTVWQLAYNQNVPMEQRLQMAILPCTVYRNNFEERVEAIRLLLTLIPHETAKKYLADHWQRMPIERMVNFERREHILAQERHLIANKKFIYELGCQETLPTQIRDSMYELLRDMVPLVDAR